jgi:hypothetical protein
MKESYGEGVANHTGPESCVVVREGGGEALTGERAGQPLSRENGESLSGADAVEGRGRQHRLLRHREQQLDPARSQTLRMHGSTLHGNREILPSSGRQQLRPDRIGKSKDARR